MSYYLNSHHDCKNVQQCFTEKRTLLPSVCPICILQTGISTVVNIQESRNGYRQYVLM